MDLYCVIQQFGFINNHGSIPTYELIFFTTKKLAQEYIVSHPIDNGYAYVLLVNTNNINSKIYIDPTN